MNPFHRSVGLIIRIKNKHRICSVQLHSGSHIHTFDTCFQLSFQWMINHKKVKQQYRQRVPIRILRWSFLSPDNLRSHKTRCTKYSARLAVIERNIVIITNQHITIIRIEKQITKGNILVFRSHSM